MVDTAGEGHVEVHEVGLESVHVPVVCLHNQA